MIAMHDQFTHQMGDRLKTTAIGLGLVRLLQVARRFEEARATLYSLENDFQDIGAGKPSNKPCKANRLKGDPQTISCSSALASTRINADYMLTRPSSIA